MHYRVKIKVKNCVLGGGQPGGDHCGVQGGQESSPGADAGLVPGGLGGFLGVEAADPFGLAHAGSWVWEADHIGP